MPLSTAVIAFESEEAARRRLEGFGYAPDVAAEIAVYLAQSTDLPGFVREIADALARDGIEARFTPLDDLALRLRDLSPRRDETIVWALTDGVRFYRGSSVPALARLEGFPRFGSPSTTAHLAQDKFTSLALASAAGLPVAPTRLIEGDTEIAALGDWPKPAGPLFVKPNTLGAKIGILADSLCQSLAEAKDRARRVQDRYRDRALIQPFVEGDDVRVSFIDLGGDLADQLGVVRIVKNPASEAGGAFLTMKDNKTLSGRWTRRGRAAASASGTRPSSFRAWPICAKRVTNARKTPSPGFSTVLHGLRGLSDCVTASRSTFVSTRRVCRPFSNSRSARRLPSMTSKITLPAGA